MSLSNLSSVQLSQLISLIKEKEALLARTAEIDLAIKSLETGTPIPKKRGRKPGRPPGSKSVPAVEGKVAKRGKRLKSPLLKLLEAAGEAGLTVEDIADKLKVEKRNIFSWFYTTGKKIKGINKIGEAKYAYKS